MRKTQIAFSTLLGLALPLSSFAADYRYDSFLSLRGAPTGQYVSPNGINDDGVIVGSTGNQGFIFAHGVTTYVAVPGAAQTSLDAIDRVGDIVGSTSVTLLGQYLGFSFSDTKGVLQPIEIIKDGNLSPTGVIGFSSRGTFLSILDQHDTPIGETLDSKLTSSGYQLEKGHTFVVPGAADTLPTAINDHGQIVGFYYDSSGEHSFLLSHGVYTSVDMPGGATTFPFGINNHGTIVGNYYDRTEQRQLGFVLKDGVFTTISVPGATKDIYVNAIGEGGSIVGFYYTGAGNTGSVGFVARPID